MSRVHFHTPRFSLTEKLRQSDGMSVADAVQAAQANVAGLSEEALKAVDNALAAIGKAAADLPGEFDDQALARLYRLSNEMIGLGSAAGLKLLDPTAYSLCDLIDGMRSQQRYAAEPIAVHVQALHLLRSFEISAEDAVVRDILSGLTRVRDKYAPEKPKPAA